MLECSQKAIPVSFKASELSAVAPKHCNTPFVNQHSSSPAPAQIWAVHGALLVQSEVPFARGMLPIAVEPAFGGVVSPAAVDVEELVRVGHGGDPVWMLGKANVKRGEDCVIC